MNFEKQKCVLRLELIAGYKMLLNKDQLKCFIEFKLDGETKQSDITSKMDYNFDQVFHFHVNQNKNAKRELQVLLCNINRGGYLNKQTLASKLLSELDFELNKQFSLDLTSSIQGKNTVKISLTYSFINNLFIDDVKGDVTVRLQNMLVQRKGILSMTLTKGFTKLTSVPGTACTVKNESPYCKLTLLYYADLDIKDYSKEKQIELSKKQFNEKQDIYLCDLKWVSLPDGTLNVLLEKVNLKDCAQLKLQFTLKRTQIQQSDQNQQQIIQPTKKFLSFHKIQLEGFPINELPNAKYYLKIYTPNCLFFTHLNNIPEWNCEFGFYEQDFVASLFNYTGDTSSALLAMFQSRSGNEGKLSEQYLKYLRDYYGQNINDYKKLTENLNLRITYFQDPQFSPIIDNPEGIVNLQDSDYCINEYSGGYKAFKISSIYDYIQIRKYRENKIEESYDMPVFKIQDKIRFFNQEIEFEYEPIKKNKQIVEEKNDKSNFVKITVQSIQITKNEYLQLKITAEEIEFQTSKNKGIYFGQSFICKHPNKLQFQLKNLTDTDIIKDIYSSFLDLSQLEFNTYESFINVLLIGSGKQCILTLKLEFSGRISEKNSLQLIPVVNFPATQQGFFFVRSFYSFRFYYDSKQLKSENNVIEFEKINWPAEDVWKPIRFQIFFQQGAKEEEAILKGDYQFQAIDLMWRNKGYVQIDFFRINIVKTAIELPEQQKQIYKPISDALQFVKFTPLNFQFSTYKSELINGYAFQLAHVKEDNVDRIKDTRNFQYMNSIMENNRTEINTLKYPASVQLKEEALPLSLLTLVQDEVKISLGKISIEDGSRSSIHYYENRDQIPQILKFKLDVIQHIRISHTSIYEILITNIQIDKQFKDQLKLHIGQTTLINYPWIKDGNLENQIYKETVPPIKFDIEEIETCFEFVLFAESLIYRRHVVNLSTIQFQFNSEQTEGSYEYERDEFKCMIIVKQLEGTISSELKVSLQTMTKMKNFATKFIKYKFSNNFEELEFSSKLRYSFLTSRQAYITSVLKRSEGSNDGEFAYTIIVPEQRFPRNHSVAKIFLGERELYIRKKEETRSEEDMDTVLETKLKIRKIYILSTQPTQKLTCLTKEGQIIELDQKYLVYKEIKTNFTIGRFEIAIYRIMKDVKKDYENKFIAPDLRIKLKYNKQTYLIQGVTEQGLMSEGIFSNCVFYVSDLTELLKIQLYVHDYLVAEGEYCVPLLKQQFVQQIFRIIYTNNDLIYFFHQRLNLKNIWIMGSCNFKPMNWKKIFLRFKKLIINLEDEEENTIRNFSILVKNEHLHWLSQIYSTTRKQVEIDFFRTEIVHQIISEGEKDNYFKIILKINGQIFCEKIMSLRPFIQRNVQDYPFEIQLNDKATLQTVIEVSQKFKSDMQRKPRIEIQKFDFRKSGYKDLFLRMLNDLNYLERGLSEIYEFLMYNTSDKYDPDLIIKICKSVFCVFNDKIKLVTLSIQCIASVYVSQNRKFAIQANHFHLLQQLQDLILVKDKNFKKLLNQPYYEEYLPQFQSQIENLEFTEAQLISFLKANKFKYQENLFDDSIDRLSAKVVLASFKIFGNLLQYNQQIVTEFVQYLSILREAYHQYDDYNIDIGTAFTILINSIINITYDQKQAKLENSGVLDYSNTFENITRKELIPNSQGFYELLLVFFDTVEKASQQNFVAILITMNNLVKILNKEQEPFLKLILKYLIRSLVIQQDLELHIGIVVEYFQPTNKELIRKALKGVDLENIALKIAEQEFLNKQSSNVLSNLFDIVIQSIELGEEDIIQVNGDQVQSQQLYQKFIGFLKSTTPKLESNKVKIEKFLLYIDKRVERAQKLQALKNKEKEKIYTQEPETIAEKKKRNMERFMISKLPW